MATEISNTDQRVSQRHAGLHLLVFIPALNEEATIEQVISSIPNDIEGVGSIDVLVVDDGSTDRTGELARNVGATVIRHDRPRGVGSAFHSALGDAIDSGVDLLVTIDADGQFNSADIPQLVAPVIADEADFSTASRFIDPALTPDMPWIKKWGNRQMSRMVSRLTKHTYYDVSCGMRCYNRKALLNLNLMGAFTYTQEVFLNLTFKKLRLTEIPIQVRGERAHGESRVAANLWNYGLQTLLIIFSAYRDYRPLRFFGSLSLLMFVPAVLLGGFLLIHYGTTGGFSPHKWAGFTSATLFVLSLISLHIGILGDMMKRHRIYLEEVLRYTRMSRNQRDS